MASSRLPPGRHGLSREYVAEHQRGRVLAAMAEVVAKRGYRNTAISRICTAAGIARNTFYEYFPDKEQCFLATFDHGVELGRERIERAADGLDSWPEQMRAGFRAVLDLIAEEPALARFCIVEVLSAGPAAIARYEETIAELIPLLARGREWGPRRGEDAVAIEETVVRGLVWMLYRRLVVNEARGIAMLLPEMIEFGLAPYLGDEQARRLAEAGGSEGAAGPP